MLVWGWECRFGGELYVFFFLSVYDVWGLKVGASWGKEGERELLTRSFVVDACRCTLAAADDRMSNDAPLPLA